MTDAQFMAAAIILNNGDVKELHHGDCVGSDAESYEIALPRALRDECRIIVHPPVDERHRAFCEAVQGKVIVLPAKTHFARNRDIVAACDVLVGTPYHEYEESVGGTWYTINYARKLCKWLVIIWPSGKLTIENQP